MVWPFWTWKQRLQSQPSTTQAEADKSATNDPDNGKISLSLCGLDSVCEPRNPVVDIVFVHGLGGHRATTWKRGDVIWPRDYLQEDLPTARIMMYGYDSSTVSLHHPVSDSTLRDQGNTLAMTLARERQFNEHTDRPLIFVAHSLGGLVVEQALLIASADPKGYMRSIMHSTVGILFMGTPHAGSDLAEWSNVLTRMSLQPPNKDILNALKRGSETLAGLQQSFQTLLRARTQDGQSVPQLFCFYENRAYNRLTGLIVPRHSAILTNCDGHQLIDADHIDMVKFASRTEKGYKDVLGQLRIWLLELQDRVQEEVQQKSQTVRVIPPVRYNYYQGTTHGAGQVVNGDVTFTRDVTFRVGHT